MQNNNQEIIREIGRELRALGKPANRFRLLRAKDGIYVYECLYGGLPAVAKYFARDEDKREIQNYRLLMECGVPTIPTYALGASVVVMEDISRSDGWRLGSAADMDDVCVARWLARWYFALHEAGTTVAALDDLYFEYDAITRESLSGLLEKLPEAAETVSFLLEHFDALRVLIDKPACTLTYNDFYWTNFIVRRDGQEALMFDYNQLGRGYRYSDFRNVSSLSGEAYSAFVDAYNLLHTRKHGHDRAEQEREEARIDAVASPLFALLAAFDRKEFPAWAEDERRQAVDGSLLDRAKRLLL